MREWPNRITLECVLYVVCNSGTMERHCRHLCACVLMDVGLDRIGRKDEKVKLRLIFSTLGRCDFRNI